MSLQGSENIAFLRLIRLPLLEHIAVRLLVGAIALFSLDSLNAAC